MLCKHEWEIEFRNGYADLESKKCMENAVIAWNGAGRDDRLL